VGAQGILCRALIPPLDEVIQLAAPDGLGRRSANTRSKGKKLTVLRLTLPTKQLCRIARALDRHLYPCLRTVFFPIPPDSTFDLRKNYSEQLPKTFHFKTALIGTRAGRARRVSDALGVTDLLKSERLRLLGERLTGKQLEANPACQVICYEAGDFCGPHNDHHPEQSLLRDGYVDVHIMLSEPTVMSQLLVYEKRRGLLNAVEEVGSGLGIAVYQLPFWHYTTPLVPRSGAHRARRWVFLASYIIQRHERRSLDRPATNVRF